MIPPELSAQQAWSLIQRGEAVLVDLRMPPAFAQSHVRGALNLPLSQRSFAERLAQVVPAGTSLVLFGEGLEQTKIAWAQLQGEPFEVHGIVKGGITAWEAARLPVESLAEVSTEELVRFKNSANVTVLDVREPMEWETGHVPGAMLISLGDLRESLDRVPRHGRILVICETGIRSSVAASLLQAEGFADVANVSEGTRGCRNAGLPLEYWRAG